MTIVKLPWSSSFAISLEFIYLLRTFPYLPTRMDFWTTKHGIGETLKRWYNQGNKLWPDHYPNKPNHHPAAQKCRYG